MAWLSRQWGPAASQQGGGGGAELEEESSFVVGQEQDALRGEEATGGGGYPSFLPTPRCMGVGTTHVYTHTTTHVCARAHQEYVHHVF